jgi:hypothetical protein
VPAGHVWHALDDVPAEGLNMPAGHKKGVPANTQALEEIEPAGDEDP